MLKLTDCCSHTTNNIPRAAKLQCNPDIFDSSKPLSLDNIEDDIDDTINDNLVEGIEDGGEPEDQEAAADTN